MFYLYLDIPYPYSRSLCVIFLCLVTQTCSTLCASMDYSPPGSSVCGDSPGKTTGVCCHALLLGIFLTQGWNPDIPHCRWILYQLSHQGSEVKWTPLSCVWFFATPWTVAHQAPLSVGILPARILEWVAISFFRGFSQPKDRTHVSYISCIGRWVLYH